MSELTPFTYDGLDSETRIVVQQRTGEIKSLMKRTAQDILDIGTKMLDVQRRIQHGTFLGWLQLEFPNLGRSTAYNLMAVARQFDGANFQQLEISTKALYLLSASATPDAARAEAIERAQAGERITHTTAQQIVTQHHPAPPRQTYSPPTYSPPPDPEPIDDEPLDWGGADDPYAGVVSPAPERPRSTYSPPTGPRLHALPPPRVGPPTPRLHQTTPADFSGVITVVVDSPDRSVEAPLDQLHTLPRPALVRLKRALDQILG